MLGIQIGNEFLDLLPSSRMDMEMENPFLQFSNQLTGDYSLPIEVAATPKNMRLLLFAGLLPTRVDAAGILAAVYDGQNQHSVGRLKIEQPVLNLLSANRGRLSMYYLTGSAGFFQEIKDLKMRQVNLGGTRTFLWDGYNQTTGTGFWHHIHQVMNAPVNSYDYAIYPVENKQLAGSDGFTNVQTDLMNFVRFEGGQVTMQRATTDGQDLNFISVFPYLHFVLKQTLAHVGWTIDGAMFQDPDFLKITMLNFKAVDWGFMSPRDRARWTILGPSSEPGTHPASVDFDLADHMPDLTVSDFLLALKNRFGWYYEFDNRNKKIKVQELQNVVATNVKDFTRQASPVITKKVAQTGKIYSLKNDFLGDYANGQPDLANVSYQGGVNHIADLPAAALALAGQVYLVRAENNYYSCRPVPGATTDTYSWQFYAYNVYDVVPTGATDDVSTKATTVGVQQYAPGTADGSYLDLIPRIDMAPDWNQLTFSSTTWGIHLMMYQGLRNNKAGQPVPFACSGIYDSQGVQVSQWALAFKCEAFDGSQVGLYDLKWKRVLDSVNQPETFEFSLYLERAEFLQLKFSDTILINGVKMYLTKMKPTIPFTMKDGEAGQLQVEALRI